MYCYKISRKGGAICFLLPYEFKEFIECITHWHARPLKVVHTGKTADSHIPSVTQTT